MNKRVINIFGIGIIVIFLISCVSGKKYSALQDTSKQFMNERDAFKTDNIGLEMKNKEYEEKLATTEKEITAVKKDISAAQSSRDKAVDDFNKISGKYNELQNAQEDLVKGNVK